MKLKLADLIKTKRKSLNMSQKKLAEGICTQTIISRLEKGEVTPSIDIFFKIIKKLNIPTSEIEVLFDIDTKEYQPSNFKVNELVELLYKRDYKTLDFVLSSIDKNTLDSENILYFSEILHSYKIKMGICILLFNVSVDVSGAKDSFIFRNNFGLSWSKISRSLSPQIILFSFLIALVCSDFSTDSIIESNLEFSILL